MNSSKTVIRWRALLLAIMAPATSLLSAEFRLGTAAVPINPPPGIALAGYYHERANGSDASRFAIAGIPSVILGPGSIDQAHAAEEYMDFDQVVGAVEIYAHAFLEF